MKATKRLAGTARQVSLTSGPTRVLLDATMDASGSDVFISYTSSDWGWARWLDHVLREVGYVTRIQGYDFAVGRSFVNAMDEALIESRLVACLLSPAYLGSRWCVEEWQSALTAGKLFPLRIADCAPEGLLGTRAYLDLVGCSEKVAEEELLAAIKERLGEGEQRPKEKPSFPGTAPAPSRRPQFPGSLPKIWNITEERNPYFTGRDEHLQKVHHALTEGQTAALTQAMMGLGGVGKTQLALEYAYRYASEYDAVWWLHAEGSVTLARDYVALAPHLGVAQVADQGEMIREVWQALSRRERTLLIFDNATEPNAIKPYLPVGPGRRIIVTTRAHAWPGATSQAVNELSLESAIEFLLRRTNQKDKAAAEEVALRLGCLPLALEQAAAYMEACDKRLGDYAKLLKKRGLEVLEKGQPHRYEQTVGTTWALAFEVVEGKCPAAAELLNLCAFLASDAIYVGELAHAAAHLPDALATMFNDELALDEAKATLLRFSLIRTEDDAIAVHRLVQEVTRGRLAPDARDRWLSAALRAVYALFPQESHDVRTWPACSRWLAHALAVVSWDKAPALEADACARLLNQAGVYLKSRASYAEAEPLFRRALAIDEASYGPNHPSVARDLNNLANLLRDTNRLTEAEPLYRRALSIDEASYGPSHPEVGTYLCNLATLLRDTNRHSEAEPLFRRALEIWEKSYGEHDPHVAAALNNLGLLLRDTNRYSEAEPLFRRALAIDEASYGPSHPDVARDINNLAVLLRDTNRHSEAEPLFRRALAIWQESYGEQHPQVATALNNLADLLYSTNRHSEVEPLFRRALAIDEASYGPDHPDVARDINNLAVLLRDSNRLTEAEPLHRRALAIWQESYGEHHPHVATALNNLALLLRDTDRLTEAEPLLRRALTINEASLGPNHPHVALRLNNLANLVRATNRHSEAEPLYRRALAIDEASRGPSHPNVAIGLNNLAGLLNATNRHSEAEPLYRRALRIFETSYGPDHPWTVTCRNNLALLTGHDDDDGWFGCVR